MNKLWLGFAAIAAYGSIYPFNFQFHKLDSGTWQAFFETCCHATSRGDILGNVVLFLPYGFLGILAAKPETRSLRGFLFVTITGFVFALLLQIAQLALPTRDENLQDVVWNLLGVAVGAGLGLPLRRPLREAVEQSGRLQLVPLILIGSWLSYRLIPFVPSIDFQSIKDSIKPLLSLETLSIGGVAFNAVAWLLVGYFLKQVYAGKRLDGFLPLVMLATFGLEILVVYNALTPANLIGALIAAALYSLVFARRQAVELPLLAALLLALAWNGLAPFMPRVEPAAFNWLPFQGFLGGSMFVNAQSASGKVFLYGSIVFLLLRLGAGSWISLVAATAWVAAIEIGQIYFGGHTPEITDPLLVVFAALAITAIQGSNRAATPGTTAGWVTHRVNLNAAQSELLEDLARELGVSVHEANRKIIDAVIREAGPPSREPDENLRKLVALLLDRGPGPSGPQAEGSGSEGSGSVEPEDRGGQWVARDLALHPEQYRLLQKLAIESGASVSRMARRMVDCFFTRLVMEES